MARCHYLLSLRRSPSSEKRRIKHSNFTDEVYYKSTSLHLDLLKMTTGYACDTTVPTLRQVVGSISEILSNTAYSRYNLLSLTPEERFDELATRYEEFCKVSKGFRGAQATKIADFTKQRVSAPNRSRAQTHTHGGMLTSPAVRRGQRWDDHQRLAAIRVACDCKPVLSRSSVRIWCPAL
jgi:hypothetical protein